MVVMTQVKVFWVVMPCGITVGHQELGGPCCLCLQREVYGAGKWT